MDETDHSADPPANPASETPQEKPQCPSFAEGQPATDNSVHPKTEARETSDQPEESKIMSAWKFITKSEHANAVMAIFTIMIFFATCAYTFVAIRSNDINREALQSVQRAFAYVDTFDVDWLSDPKSPEQITALALGPRIKNSGTTPAVNASNYSNIVHLLAQMPDDFKFPDYDRNGKVIANAVGFKTFFAPQSTNAAYGNSVAINLLDQSSPARQFVYVYGWIRYRDVFKGTPEHRTLWCYQVWLDTRGQPVTKGVKQEITFAMCPKHNCTDEQCDAE